MTPERLEKLGLAIFGKSWRSALARAVEADRAQVYQWTADEGSPARRPIPDYVGPRLLDYIDARRVDLAKIADKVRLDIAADRR